MANIPIWPGSSSFHPGDTPFGFYDTDIEFQSDANKVSVFSARRLGYPIVDVELQDLNFFAAFEEAVTVYGNEVYAYKIRENYLSLDGADTTIDINDSIVTPSLARIIELSEQYGTEAGTGGNVDWKQGAVKLQAGKQEYDLDAWAVENGYLKGDIEIKKVFFEGDPAIIKFFDPYVGSGAGIMNVMDSFGWGNYSPAINFVLMPINYDLQVIQQIELNDMIRRSNFSFEIHNNKLRIFPIPTQQSTAYAPNLYFDFLLKSERIANSIKDLPGKINDISRVPYVNPIYTKINSVGRSWIFEYTLALCKEMLGYIRGKYDTVPIPGSEVQLNEADLITAATTEKQALIDRLRAYLDETSREKLLERRSLETEYRKTELTEVPNVIYIG